MLVGARLLALMVERVNVLCCHLLLVLLHEHHLVLVLLVLLHDHLLILLILLLLLWCVNWLRMHECLGNRLWGLVLMSLGWLLLAERAFLRVVLHHLSTFTAVASDETTWLILLLVALVYRLSRIHLNFK